MPLKPLAFALCTLVALAVVPTAAADGDPASDTLLLRNVFYPYNTSPQDTDLAALQHEVSAVYAHGDRIKIAIVQSANDLGSIPGLFDKPTEYAAFLGQEIRYYYVGPLLVVMPAGFGIYDGGRPVATETTALARSSIAGSSTDELIRSATAAVTSLMARDALRSKDILAPYAYPGAAAAGKRGGLVRLSYSAFDDSGRASIVITVLSGPATSLAVFRIPLGAVAVNQQKWVSWRAPEKPSGKLRYCVAAADPTGNRSRLSCAPIALH